MIYSPPLKPGVPRQNNTPGYPTDLCWLKLGFPESTVSKSQQISSILYGLLCQSPLHSHDKGSPTCRLIKTLAHPQARNICLLFLPGTKVSVPSSGLLSSWSSRADFTSSCASATHPRQPQNPQDVEAAPSLSSPQPQGRATSASTSIPSAPSRPFTPLRSPAR